LESLPIAFHSTSRLLADAAADFKACHKIRLADSFAAALTKERTAELITEARNPGLLRKKFGSSLLSDTCSRISMMTRSGRKRRRYGAFPAAI
jgi:hypothetical protein